MSSRVTVTLSHRQQRVPPVTVSARSVEECARILLARPPSKSRVSRGCSEPLDASSVGIPPHLKARAELVFEQLARHGPETAADEAAEFLSRAEALDAHRLRLPLLRALDKAARNGEPFPPAMLPALADPAFHRTAREAGLDMSRVAAMLASGDPTEAEDILDAWEESLFVRVAENRFPPGACADLSSTIQRLAGDGPGQHAFNWGACAAFAEVLNGVLDAGGHYVALAGRRFDPETSPGCHHVALRVGGWVVDGKGASRLGPFLADWNSTFDDMHEVHMPYGGGFLDRMRPRGDQLLDSKALDLDLLAAGVGPHMVLQERGLASDRTL